VLGQDQNVGFSKLDDLFQGQHHIPILPYPLLHILTLCTDNHILLLPPINASPPTRPIASSPHLPEKTLQELNSVYPALCITLLLSAGHKGCHTSKLANDKVELGVELGRSVLDKGAREVAGQAEARTQCLGSRMVLLKVEDKSSESESKEEEGVEWRPEELSLETVAEQSRREAWRTSEQQEKQRAAEFKGMTLPQSIPALSEAEEGTLKQIWTK
jgi:hypothetical protein